MYVISPSRRTALRGGQERGCTIARHRNLFRFRFWVFFGSGTGLFRSDENKSTHVTTWAFLEYSGGIWNYDFNSKPGSQNWDLLQHHFRVPCPPPDRVQYFRPKPSREHAKAECRCSSSMLCNAWTNEFLRRIVENLFRPENYSRLRIGIMT
jgi:hypothetical protein